MNSEPEEPRVTPSPWPRSVLGGRQALSEGELSASAGGHTLRLGPYTRENFRPNARALDCVGARGLRTGCVGY